MTNIGFQAGVVGLGSMGMGMATSGLKAGLSVTGADISATRQAEFEAAGGQTLTKDVLSSLDLLAIVVLNVSQMEDVLFGPNGYADKLSTGAVVMGCATIPPSHAVAISNRCAEYNLLYIDAPISGGSVKAAQGALTIMASGAPEAFDAAQPFLDAVAERVFILGDAAGPGSAMKAANQLLAGVHIATMAEAMTFGMTQGIAPKAFLDVISQCAGTSWMLENRAPHIISGDYTPHSQVNIWPKDLGIVLDIAAEAGFDAPVTQAALAQYRAAVEDGLGAEDDAAVAKVYAKQAGIDLPEAK